MPDGGNRQRNVLATRRRIAEVALDLFQRQGYADTTIDQIAAAADVGRRTIFRHFPTKEAILVDHLAIRREVTLQRLEDRPPDEAPLVSLHTVLRELAAEGYDRRLLDQVRAILTTEPQVARDALSVGGLQFENKLAEILLRRGGDGGGTRSALEVKAVTFMATTWFVTAIHIYLVEDRPSLVACFDEVVATCRSALTDAAW